MVVGAASVVAVGWVHRSTPVGAAGLMAVVAVSAWLAAIDFREHRLPNRIVGPLALAVTIGVLVAGAIADDPGRAGRAIGFGLALSAVLLAVNVIDALGMGDVKYGYPMATAVGWFGWNALAVAILVMTVGGGLVAVAALMSGKGRRHRLSYGPYMALGLVAGLLVT